MQLDEAAEAGPPGRSQIIREGDERLYVLEKSVLKVFGVGGAEKRFLAMGVFFLDEYH
jgi:hypothetical protein